MLKSFHVNMEFQGEIYFVGERMDAKENKVEAGLQIETCKGSFTKKLKTKY